MLEISVMAFSWSDSTDLSLESYRSESLVQGSSKSWDGAKCVTHHLKKQVMGRARQGPFFHLKWLGDKVTCAAGGGAA
jgi:hypothetical protein